MSKLHDLLAVTASMHHQLCPKQVLGVRMGMYAGELLGLDLPQKDKRLLCIAETDGCFVDGISAATGCWVGRRTLRIEDYGKVAASFVDKETATAIRLVPHMEARQRSVAYAPEAGNVWEAYLFGYQRMHAGELFAVQEIILREPLDWLVSAEGKKAICSKCGEEVLNEREQVQAGDVFCEACLRPPYYSTM